MIYSTEDETTNDCNCISKRFRSVQTISVFDSRDLFQT